MAIAYQPFSGPLSPPVPKRHTRETGFNVYGTYIPLSCGTRIVEGVPVWASEQYNDLDNTRVPLATGLLGAAAAALAAPHIKGDFAIAFGEPLALPAERGDIGVKRLWANNVKIYDANDLNLPSQYQGIEFTVYDGKESQLPDAVHAAVTGNITTAYRALIYIVFKAFPVGLFSGGVAATIPSFKAELVDGLSTEPIKELYSPSSPATYSEDDSMFVDWSTRTMYGVTLDGDDWYLNSYNIDNKALIASKLITKRNTAGGSPMSNLTGGLGTTVAVDEKRKRAYLSINSTPNSPPIAELDYTTGVFTNVFGEGSNDLTPVLGANGSVPFPSYSDVLTGITKSGEYRSMLIIGSGTPNSVSLCSFAGPEGLTVIDYFDGLGDINDIKPYPLYKRRDWASKAQQTAVNPFGQVTGPASPGQDAAFILCVGDKAYIQYVSLENLAFQERVEILHVPGYFVRFCLINHTDYSLVFLCSADPSNSPWRAIRLDVAVYNQTFSDWNGLRPVVQSGDTVGMNGMPVSARKFDVVITDYIGNSESYNATKNSDTQGGLFYYPKINSIAYLNLNNGVNGVISASGNTPSGWYITDAPKRRIHAIGTDSVRANDVLLGINTSGAQTLDRVLTWLAVAAGFDENDIEVDGVLDDPVLGVLIQEPIDTNALFLDMGKVYDFVHFESAGKIKFLRTNDIDDVEPEGAHAVDGLVSINEGAAGINELLQTEFPGPNDVSVGYTLSYLDPAMDYASSKQTYSAANSVDPDDNTTLTDISIPVVMTAAEAYQRVSRLTVEQTKTNIAQVFRLPPKNARYEPGAVLSLTFDNFLYLVRVDEITFNGDWSMSILSRNYAFRDNIPVQSDGYLGGLPQAVPGASTSFPIYLDMTLLEPANDVALRGVAYIGTGALTPASWSGADLSEALLSNYQFSSILHTSAQAPTATLDAAIVGDPRVVDNTNSFILRAKSMVADDLDDADDETEMLTAVNTLIVGAPGRWEVIYFQTVTVLDDFTFQISDFIRGMRGTDVFSSLSAAGDLAILVRSKSSDFVPWLRTNAKDVDLLDTDYVYRATGDGSLAVPAYDIVTTFRANSLRPWAPDNVIAGVMPSPPEDILISWVRRDRKESIAENDSPVPMSEETEEYEIDFYADDEIVRTETNILGNSFIYTAAMQTEDGFTPPVSSIDIDVRQISATVGRGFGRRVVVTDIVPDFVTLTIPSGTTASDLTDFPLLVDIALMPSDFKTAINTNAGNLRAYADDGSTLLYMDVLYWDGTDGKCFVKVPLVDADADTVIIFRADGDPTQPAVGASGGRDGVWSDYETVLFGDDLSFTDHTGKCTYTINFTIAGSAADITSEPVSSPLFPTGKGLFFSNDVGHAGGESITSTTFVGGDLREFTISWSLMLWKTSSIDNYAVGGLYNSANINNRKTMAWRGSDSSGQDGMQVWDSTNSWFKPAPTPYQPTANVDKFRATLTYSAHSSGTRRQLWNGPDGGFIASAGYTSHPIGNRFALGGESTSRSEPGNFFADFVYVRSGVLSDDWLRLEYDMMDDPASVYSMT